MHLLAALPGEIEDGSVAVDLGQTPGDVVVLSASDTELAALSTAYATARQSLAGQNVQLPSLRLANLLHLTHNLSVDLYVENVIAHAKLVVVRLLGGRAYWPYGVDEVVAACRENNISLVLVPGDDHADAELQRLSTVTKEDAHALWQYLLQGGITNAENFIARAASLCGPEVPWRPPAPLLAAGLYWPKSENNSENEITFDAVRTHWREGQAVVPVVFYRALVMSADLEPVDELVRGLAAAGLNALPIFAASLKDPVSVAVIDDVLDRVDGLSDEDFPLGCVINMTAFATAKPGAEAPTPTPFQARDLMVLQAVLAGGTAEQWLDGTRGLSPRDIAMHAALPEVDGRVLTRAIAFKQVAVRDEASECDVVRFKAQQDRIDFVCEQAASWAWLRTAPQWSKRVAIVLANYPNRDGRLGNGVGLDTPAGVIETLKVMAENEYEVDDIPETANALIERLQAGPTNSHDAVKIAAAEHTFALADYQTFFEGLSEAVQRAVTERWGAPQTDPFFRAADQSFAMPVFMCGETVIGLQPARGYNIDPVKSYHDPALVPPHGYLAFYGWLREEYDADAIIHFGKHGNLEWLPGKALALSENCFPEAALGPTANLYPFIVNDPGEGTQAKRRTSAVIIDHLTPPLARAETYGPLRDLEVLVDEYYEASGSDPRRMKILKRDILELCHSTGLAVDLNMSTKPDGDEDLNKLDAYLCELKEMQIRDGLHIFGQSPAGEGRASLLVALARVARGGAAHEVGITRALALDLELGFDPLDTNFAKPWEGTRPEALESVSTDDWRTAGDTVERLELLALALVRGEAKAEAGWTHTAPVLNEIEIRFRPAIDACGEHELAGLMQGLNGRFVAPGPSGAPTRGRADVLPTGRNFYSVDTRHVPTPAAWELGWKSAAMLVERHAQETGDWPRAMGLSAWGTANMRTGGDDIAQALALIGAKPTWDVAGGRVTGFEVLPASVLGRPRVDVTLRISGFFRDAFPGLIDLFDSAVRAVAALDEDESENPLAARVKADALALQAKGLDGDAAHHEAAHRVFGSQPGAYGAGLQALMDEQGWETDDDLARAYVAWGGYAYGAGAEGKAQHGLFEERLKSLDAVVQNQDNREHDILDSDDYYQFEGGMTASARALSGAQPRVWHNDHSRPETPRINTLEDEIGRVVRARATNPKWIAGVKRHGYKGAFEMAATVDYLVSFAATARCVKDHHFDAVYQAYLGDAETLKFIEVNNPEALKEMANRLREALNRGLWKPRLNSAPGHLHALAGIEKRHDKKEITH